MLEKKIIHKNMHPKHTKKERHQVSHKKHRWPISESDKNVIWILDKIPIIGYKIINNLKIKLH